MVGLTKTKDKNSEGGLFLSWFLTPPKSVGLARIKLETKYFIVFYKKIINVTKKFKQKIY